MKKLGFYLLRWQLSTPILYIITSSFAEAIGELQSVIIANFIGGLIFFWVDRVIFHRI